MRLIPILTITIVFLSACEDLTRVPELQDAPTMKIINSSEGSFFRADDLENAEISFSLYSVDLGNISRVQIFAELYDNEVDSVIYDRAEILTFIPAEFNGDGFLNDVNISMRDVSAAFNLQYIDDFTPGDVLTFYNVVTTKDGRIYPDSAMRRVNTDNNGLNIDNTGFYLGTTSSFSPGFNAFIACPTDPELWEGKYKAKLIDADCWTFDCTQTVEAEITANFNSLEPFKYYTTTHDAGYWTGFDPTVGIRPANFYDICGTPILQPVATGYGDHEGIANGSYRDDETGNIFLKWCNFFNPVCATTRFTPISD